MKVALLRVLNLTRLRHSGALINVCHHEPLPLKWGSRGVQDSQGAGASHVGGSNAAYFWAPKG